MTKNLQSIIDKLIKYQERAEELADSENEKTANRYADVPNAIAEAIEALESAVGELTE